MKKMLFLTQIAVVLLTVLMVGSTAWAQTVVGSISGVVTDPNGDPVSGATVTVKNESTGLARTLTTNETGFFRADRMPTGGNYSVTVEAQGFKKEIRTMIAVIVATDTRVDIQLSVGEVTEVVEVTATGTELLERSVSRVATNIDSRRILELPGRRTLNGLALLAPGVVPSTLTVGSGFSVNGGRTRSNNFNLDGVNNNDDSLSIPRQGLPPEAIGEFQIVTNNFTAEQGRNAGAYVNVVSKSGTNEFHGTLHWTWNGNGLDALSLAEERVFLGNLRQGKSKHEALRAARNPIIDNIGGFTFGGPILKNKSFFFGSYDFETFREAVGVSARFAITPEGLQMLKDNAQRLGFVPEAIAFIEQNYPRANDRSVVVNINAGTTGANRLLVPFARFNRGLIEGGLSDKDDFHRFLIRMDHKFSDRDQFFARYLFDDDLFPGSPTSLPGQEIGQAVRNQSQAIGYTHVFSPRAVNEFRFSYNRRAIDFPLGETVRKLGAFSIGGTQGAFSVGNANFPQFRTDNIYQYSNTYSFTFGRHSLKGGVDVRRVQLNSFFAPNSDGTVSYPSFNAFLRDINASFSQFAGEGFVPSRLTELGAFFQDDFRVTADLTLNYGARYEYTGTPFRFFSNARPDINNILPRFGFAWNPKVERKGVLGWLTGGDKFVLRGGYAISVDQIFQNVLLNVSRNFPRGVQISQTNISGQRIFDRARRPPTPTPQDFIAGGGNPLLLPLRLFSPDKRISVPYGQQYTLNIARQFLNDYVLKIAYIGSRGLHLIREFERNLGFFPPVGDGQRLDPTRGSILVGDGHASSTYHSLQVSVDKRFSRGLEFGAQWTWSSFINDSDDILGAQQSSTLPTDPRNARLDRGRSALDKPHRFVVNYIWDIPKAYGGGNRILNNTLNFWRLAGVTTFQSGSAFTVYNANNALGILPGQISTIHLSQRVSINVNGNPGTPLPGGFPSTLTGTNAQGVPNDPNAFWIVNANQSGVVGNAGRGRFRTRGTNNFDVALIKEVRFFETHRLEVRWELFNVFNHRQFTSVPPRTLSDSSILGPTQPDLNLGFGGSIPGRGMIFTARYMF